MSSTVNISIKIADRQYPLIIKQSDEKKVKEAAEKINTQLKELKEKYDGRDMQDYMAMYLMLQMNNPSSKLDTTTIDIDYKQQLQRIEKDLNDLLK